MLLMINQSEAGSENSDLTRTYGTDFHNFLNVYMMFNDIVEYLVCESRNCEPKINDFISQQYQHKYDS